MDRLLLLKCESEVHFLLPVNGDGHTHLKG